MVTLVLQAKFVEQHTRHPACNSRGVNKGLATSGAQLCCEHGPQRLLKSTEHHHHLVHCAVSRCSVCFAKFELPCILLQQFMAFQACMQLKQSSQSIKALTLAHASLSPVKSTSTASYTISACRLLECLNVFEIPSDLHQCHDRQHRHMCLHMQQYAKPLHQSGILGHRSPCRTGNDN